MSLQLDEDQRAIYSRRDAWELFTFLSSYDIMIKVLVHA